MERQHIVCLVVGLAFVGLATLVAQLAGSPAVLVLGVALVMLRGHALLRADGVAVRYQPAPAVAPTRTRRARG